MGCDSGIGDGNSRERLRGCFPFSYTHYKTRYDYLCSVYVNHLHIHV